MLSKFKSLFYKSSDSDYLKAFNLAVEKTKQNNLGVFSKLKPTADRLICESTLVRLYEHPMISQIDREQLFSMCFHIHVQLQQTINQVFSTKSTLTMGYVEYDSGKQIHYECIDSVLARVNNRCYQKEVNMHCWLTLPTLEIIDLTLPTTLAKIENKMENAGRIIAMHADELKGMKYVPQILGDKYLHLAGIYDQNIPR